MSPQRTRFPAPRANFSVTRFTQGLSTVPSFAGVYRIVCVPMRMCYVGQTHDLCKRFLEHQGQLAANAHPNSRLQGAYRKFGPAAFYFEVLEVYHDRVELDTLTPMEQRWMDAHPRRALFNVRPAGSDEWLRAQRGRAGEDNRPLGRRPWWRHHDSE